jgi:hypothetical protein
VFYEALMMNDTSHAIAGEGLRKKINPLSSVPVTEDSGAGDCICEDFNCRRPVRVLRISDDE